MKTVKMVAGLMVVSVSMVSSLLFVGAQAAYAQGGETDLALPFDISPTVPLSEMVKESGVHLKGVPRHVVVNMHHLLFDAKND